METIRIRLSSEHKNKLKEIARRDHRSMTGVIRNWIAVDSARPPQANSLFSNKWIADDTGREDEE